MEWDMKFTKATLKVKVALDIIPLEEVEKTIEIRRLKNVRYKIKA